MTDENMSDNELIATFMGYERTTHIWECSEHAYTMKLSPVFNKLIIPTHMQFNKSWDWLMPVIDKIEELGYFVYSTRLRSAPLTPNFYSIKTRNHEVIANDHKLSKIEACYTVVVKFIKWYNENKPA